MLKPLALLLVCAAAPVGAAAQCSTRFAPSSPFGAERGALRVAELLGQTTELQGHTYRASTYVARRGVCLQHAPLFGPATDTAATALAIMPVRLTTEHSSQYPHDRNNGAGWTGKGVSSTIEAGVRARFGRFTAAVAPVLTWAANDTFPLAEAANPSEFGYPYVFGIDLPQRFGNDPITNVLPGESYLRFDYRALALGLSTESLWWGPQQVFPLLMSNTAGGFPHLFAGTNRAVDVGIGLLDVELTWGELGESRFDTIPGRRLFAGVTATIQPRGLKGLSLGVARVYHRLLPGSEFTPWNLFIFPYTDPRANIEGDNQLASFFGRWVFPEHGFEFYGEWARDDHWLDLADFVRELDHSQVYAFGGSKAIDRGAYTIHAYGEAAHLDAALPIRARTVVHFYTNSDVLQGHTHRGQLLGAWIAPGGNAQILGADAYSAKMRVGAYLQRVRFSSNYYHEFFAAPFGSRGHDLELTLGGVFDKAGRNLRLSLNGELNHRRNRSFLPLIHGRTDAEWNTYLRATVSWSPGK